MISLTAEYALRVVVYLATLKDQPATTKQIAAVTRVPEGYLSKILQSLARAGLLESQRGLHGGSTLLRPPERINVLEVIEAVAPIPRIHSCPLNLPAHGTNLCPLHRRLDDAIAMVERAFQKSTIAELLAEPTESVPLRDTATDPAAATQIAEAVFQVDKRAKPPTSPGKPAHRSAK